MPDETLLHGTTILAVRHGGRSLLAGDGQDTLGQTIVKHTARKVRRYHNGQVLAGFAGASADAMALLAKFEARIEEHRGNLERAAVELARDWRTDRVLRRLEAMLAVADRKCSSSSAATATCWSPSTASWPSARAAPMSSRPPSPCSSTRSWARPKSSSSRWGLIALLSGLAPFLQQDEVFVAIALAGGVILLWMAISMFRSLPGLSLDFSAGEGKKQNLVLAGIVFSLANPYWLIWWASIGLGYIVYSVQFGAVGAVSFFAGHILADFAWYAFISFGVAKGRRYFSDRAYRGLLGVCAFFLLLFSGYFLYSGIMRLG